MGGADDWRALFHEAGHTEHYANTSADLPMEDKRLGDVAVTEGWAMLMQHLTDDPAWLTRRLDFPRPHDFELDGVTQLLYMVRRYSAKLLYEIEFPRLTIRRSSRTATSSSSATRSRSSRRRRTTCPTSTRASTSPGTCARGPSRRSSGRTCASASAATGSRSARPGSLVRELWETGSSMTADEILNEVTGQEIDMDAVAQLTRETLA